MVKGLQDCCLACIARNISSYNRLGNYLSLRHKEVLLERICWHRLLTVDNTPSILYNLLSHTLQRVNLSYSDQVNDKILSLLGESGCLLRSFVIHNCPQVTDKGVSSLGRILRKAEEIKLKDLKLLTGEALKSIKSRTLTSVNLSYSCKIEDGGVIALVGNCPNIRKLNLCGLHKVSDRGLVKVAQLLAEKLVSVCGVRVYAIVIFAVTSSNA
jgi:F-box/leucine-rich repeat protein 2/20